MHKHSQTTIIDGKVTTSTRISKALVDKMVQKYFTYLEQRPMKNVLKTGNREDDMELVSEGSVYTPLPTHVKMEHHANQKNLRVQNLKPRHVASKSGKPQPRKIEAKQIKVTKQKESLHNSKNIQAPTEIITDNIVKETITHKLDKAHTRTNSRKIPLENVHRNDQLNCAESNSTQSTNTDSSNNSGTSFRFPYQRTNRSYSPEDEEIQCFGSSKASKPGPVIPKNFIIGAQAVCPPIKSKEGLQVLRAISKSQERAGEKQCIIEDLDEDVLTVNEKPIVKEKTEVIIQKEVPKVEPPKPSIKALGKGRHRRITSQVIDKQTLQALLKENRVVEF